MKRIIVVFLLLYCCCLQLLSADNLNQSPEELFGSMISKTNQPLTESSEEVYNIDGILWFRLYGYKHFYTTPVIEGVENISEYNNRITSKDDKQNGISKSRSYLAEITISEKSKKLLNDVNLQIPDYCNLESSIYIMLPLIDIEYLISNGINLEYELPNYTFDVDMETTQTRTIIWSENFNSLPSDYEVGDSNSSNGEDYWDDVNDDYLDSGECAWCADIGGEPDCENYDDYMNSYIYPSNGINVAGLSDVHFYHYTKYVTETSWDYNKRYYSSNGSSWQLSSEYDGDSNGWRGWNTTLNNFTTYYWNYTFYSDSSNHNYYGASIDEFRIEASGSVALDVIPDVEYIRVNGTEVSNGSSITVELDNNGEFELKLRGENDGSDTVPANMGGAHISIEEFTSSSWKNNIRLDTSTSNDLEPTYDEFYGYDVSGGDGFANYVMVEAYDDDGWEPNESNNLYVMVDPGDITTLHIHYRLGFNSGNENWLTDPSSGTPGPIGDPTYEIIVHILPDVIPDVEYIKVNDTEVSNGSSITVELDNDGEFEIKLRGENDGPDTVPANLGGAHISIEEFTSSSWKNNIRLDTSTSNDLEPTYDEFYGYDVSGGDGFANYVMVEAYDDDGWEHNESNNLYVKINPGDLTTLHVHYRLGFNPGNNIWLTDPSSGNAGPIDDPTYEIVVNIQPSTIPTRFRGDHFVDKTCKYGIPILLEAKLERDTFGNLDVSGKEIDFFIKDNYGVWEQISDDSITGTSFYTDNNGIASVYYTAPVSYNQGNHEIKAVFVGDDDYCGCTMIKQLNIHKPQWTIMIYVDGDCDLESSYVSSFYNDIDNERENNEVSIVVLFDRIIAPDESWDDTSHDNWGETRYYKISEDINIYSPWYTNNSEANMGDASTLNGFISISKSSCLAENYALIFKDHGTGVIEQSINNYLINEVPDIMQNIDLEELLVETDRGICIDNTSNNDILTLSEIRQVMNAQFSSSSKLDLLAYHACVMGSIEDIYDLKNTVEIVVASEETTYSGGWHYENMFENLTNSTTASQFAQIMINECPQPTLGAWDLTNDNIEVLYTDIVELSNLLLDNLATGNTRLEFQNAINQTRGFCPYIGYPDIYFDLRQLMVNIMSNVSVNSIQDKAQQISNRLTNSTFRIGWTTSYESSLGGLSIFFPPYLSQSWDDYFDEGHCLFSSNPNQKWDDFITAFYDTTSPTSPNITYCSHEIDEWNNDDTIEISWNCNDNRQVNTINKLDYLDSIDNNNIERDVTGYSWEWSQNSETIPNDTQNGVNTYTTSYNLSNSNDWHFHIRAVDQSGNWSETRHYGPFYIDDTPPSNPIITSCSHNVNNWDNDDTINISWSSSDNMTESSILAYSYQWSNSSSTIPNNTVNGTNNSITSPALTNSNEWYFHVKAKDQAGNWSGTKHYGPFYIDSVSPITPTISYCSHEIGDWDNDDTIFISWNCSDRDLNQGDSRTVNLTDSNTRSLSGYSWEWSQAENTTPNNTVNGSENNTTSDHLSNGVNWYFHIKAVDQTDNWSTTRHFGPFHIDNSMPEGTISINNGNTSTLSQFVILHIDYEDTYSGVRKMSCSNNGSEWSDWIDDDNIIYDWDLSEYGGSNQSGTKTVYIRFRDYAGNISEPSSDQIYYTGSLGSPQNVSIYYFDNSTAISWDNVSGAISYKIWTSDTPIVDTTVSPIAHVNNTTWTYYGSENIKFFVIKASDQPSDAIRKDDFTD